MLILIAGPLLILGVVLLLCGGVLLWLLRWASPERGWLGPWLARRIAAQLGGFVQPFNTVDERLPLELVAAPQRVAVIGGGLAGIAAAATLAPRGFSVVLYERNAYLGGKIGGWRETLASGAEVPVAHGFHAFFRHYHNLNRFLDQLGLRASFAAIDDYLILERNGTALSFAGVERTPVFNLISMARAGVYRWRDILFGPAKHELRLLLEYDPRATFARFDQTSFAQFAARAGLPPRLRLAFNTFSRAFFADEARMSLAELIKSFHFYYLSHDGGLLYDYPTADYGDGVIAPIVRHLEAQGVTLRLGCGVEALARDADGKLRIAGASEAYDHVVLASDVVGTRAIVGASTFIAEQQPAFAAQLAGTRPAQGYAVLRLWLDRDLRATLPVFVITERVRLLDAIALCHRIEPAAQAWARQQGGAVLELHCYALPDDAGDDAAIAAALWAELEHFLPELRHAQQRDSHLQVRRDFAAFHVGLHEGRPGLRTPVAGLWLAGDWVALPLPAMLMEGAFTAGLLTANAILSAAGLREEPVSTVPTRGLLAGRAPEGLAR